MAGLLLCNMSARQAQISTAIAREMIEMVRKETCPTCKGNRWVTVKDPAGRDVHRKCPQCGGQGFKLRLTH